MNLKTEKQRVKVGKSHMFSDKSIGRNDLTKTLTHATYTILSSREGLIVRQNHSNKKILTDMQTDRKTDRLSRTAGKTDEETDRETGVHLIDAFHLESLPNSILVFFRRLSGGSINLRPPGAMAHSRAGEREDERRRSNFPLPRRA